MTDYINYHKHLEERLAQLGRELPGPMTGFARLHKKAVEDGALNALAQTEKVVRKLAALVFIGAGLVSLWRFIQAALA
jgi:hypothetical protein